MKRRLDRRSFLARVVGTSAALACSARLAAQQSHFEPAPPPLADTDTGPSADPAGRGRGSSPNLNSSSGTTSPRTGVARQYRYSGVTDSDAGANADPAGRPREGSVTDSDGGSAADPVGRGRGARRNYRNGITDADSTNNGSVADAPHFGRDDPRRRSEPPITDSDTGATADPIGRGRGDNR